MCGQAGGHLHRSAWVLPAVPETDLLPQGSFAPDANSHKSSGHTETRWVPKVLRQHLDQDPAGENSQVLDVTQHQTPQNPFLSAQ